MNVSHRFRGLVSALLIALAGAVAGASIEGAMAGPRLWIAAALGALVALVSSVLAERFRLVVFEGVALALALVIIVGGPAVGWLPVPSSYGDFFRGAVSSWAEVLSSVPPTPAVGPLLALPYLLAWLGAMVGLVLYRRLRVPAVAMVGPIAAFAVGLLLSPNFTVVSVGQAAVLVALVFALGRRQLTELSLEPDRLIGNTTVARRRGRLLAGSVIAAVVTVIGMLFGPLVPGVDDDKRVTLRDQLEPPWQPLDEPSPLAQIKSNYVAEVRDEPVFVIRGDNLPSRWALATLAAYDGSVWTVGDSDISGVAPFVGIDGLAPVDPTILEPLGQAGSRTVEVEILSLDGPWLPLPGRLETFESLGNGVDLRFNPRTGTAALPQGVEGARYSAVVRPWSSVTDDAARELSFPESAGIDVDQQAGAVRQWSADVVEGLDRGWDQVVAIRQLLTKGGYLADEKARPGHSLGRLNNFFANEDFYGNEEQYAAVAAIAARNAGLKARVVVGYLIDPAKLAEREIQVTRGEASAWIEVLTTEQGWVPVDVTPPRDNEPSIAEEGTRTESVAAPNPPPPPPPPPEIDAETPDEDPEEDDEKDPEEETGTSFLPGLIAGATASLLIPVTLVGSWLLLMVALKRRRRRRRAKSEAPVSVAGAWFELVDRLEEAGIDRGDNLSVREQSELVGAVLGDGVQSARLSTLVDRAAFSASSVDGGDAAQAWSDSDALVDRLNASASRPTRLRRLADPRALLSADPGAERGRRS